MLDFSWSHILLLLIVALVVVGPKDLPKLMRMVGRWTGKARAMADQLRKSFDEMARQSELEDLRAEIEALRRQRPLADVEQSLQRPVVMPAAPVEPVKAEAQPEPEPSAKSQPTEANSPVPEARP